MQLHQLELFCEVAKDEHMTKTAERLHISQPALTKTVRNLEQEIGVKLFVRTGRNIRLNDNGKFFYNAVSHALSDIQAALEELKQRELSESPAITVINQISEHFGNIFEDFHERYPGSSVWELQAEGAVEDMLLSKNASFGLSYYPSAHADIDCMILMEDEFLLLVAPEHPLALSAEVPVRALRSEPNIAYTGISLPESLRIHMRAPQQRLSNLMSVVRMVEENHGITILPASTWYHLQPKVLFLRRAGRCPVAKRLAQADEKCTIHIMWNAMTPLRQEEQTFLRFCQEYFVHFSADMDSFRQNGYCDTMDGLPPRS